MILTTLDKLISSGNSLCFGHTLNSGLRQAGAHGDPAPRVGLQPNESLCWRQKGAVAHWAAARALLLTSRVK